MLIPSPNFKYLLQVLTSQTEVWDSIKRSFSELALGAKCVSISTFKDKKWDSFYCHC
ncbi:hypothetical protein SMBr_04390 [Shewanella sp. M-Br]|nr:hypothetical protein SMBr_04390 [Shewanella sp. M-Br]